MDVSAVAQVGIALQGLKTMDAMAAAVVKKELDIQKQQGAMAVQLIENSAIPPAAGGAGSVINTTA